MAKPGIDAATAAARLTEEIARLTADRDQAALLAQVDQLLIDRRAELAAIETELATARAEITAAAATHAQLAADTKAERAVLVQLGMEKETLEREIRSFGRQAEAQSARFRDQIRALVPREPATTDAEDMAATGRG